LTPENKSYFFVDLVTNKMTSKWTVERELRLVELCETYKSDIDGTGNSPETNKRRNAAWNYITEALNAETRSNFNFVQVKKKYQNLKSTAKFKIANNAKSRSKTGGGLHTELTLTEAERQLEATLGMSKGFCGEKYFVESRLFPDSENIDPNQIDEGLFTQVKNMCSSGCCAA
jgi:hypothetical protein